MLYRRHEISHKKVVKKLPKLYFNDEFEHLEEDMDKRNIYSGSFDARQYVLWSIIHFRAFMNSDIPKSPYLVDKTRKINTSGEKLI